MSYCKKCGQEIPIDTNCCPNCGNINENSESKNQKSLFFLTFFILIALILVRYGEDIKSNLVIFSFLQNQHTEKMQPKNNSTEGLFKAYMHDMQLKIKEVWTPPKYDSSKQTVLSFKINKDGSVCNIKVFKSSGEAASDNAAIEAVKKASPFAPLPEQFSGNSVDIQFTFDYNVFNKKK